MTVGRKGTCLPITRQMFRRHITGSYIPGADDSGRRFAETAELKFPLRAGHTPQLGKMHCTKDSNANILKLQSYACFMYTHYIQDVLCPSKHT